MNRREAIAGAASLGVLGTGGVLAVGGVPSFGTDPSGADRSGSDAQLDEPMTIETVDLPWSDGEPMTVPVADSVTVLEFWATTCPICANNLPDVTAAHERVGADVQFLSVTWERVGPDGAVSRDDVLDWWTEHGGGEWAIGYDDKLRLQTRFTAAVTPATAILDADGVARWTHEGAVSTEKLLAEIEAAGGTVGETGQ